MAVSWIIMLLTVAMAMTLTLNVVKCDEMYTTVSPEKQAELEKLDSDPKNENLLDDGSGDDDPGLDVKVNKTGFTTPTVETTEQDKPEHYTEAVGGVLSSEESVESSEESVETTTEVGSGNDDDIFATQFPPNIEHALNETEDKELLPASEATTGATTTEEGFIVPVLVDRKPAQSRPEEDARTTTQTTEDEGKQVVLKPETTATDKPTTAEDKKDEFVFAVPANAPEIHSKSGSDLHDVDEAEEFKPTATTSAPSDDNPSAQATKGDRPISRGAIVGIVIIGVVVLLGLIILLVYLLVFRPRRKALKHNVDADDVPPPKENGQVANGAPKNNEESMSALVKSLKDDKLSSGKDKTYGTELKDDMEDVKLNGTADKSDSPV